MPDLGDYVTRLIADSSKYSSGVQQAVGSNRELSGSVQSIIGQLTRQQRELENAGRSTLQWIEADKKASAEAKEHARALLDQVNAMKAAKTAADQLAAAEAKRNAAIPKSTVVTDPMRGTFRLDDPYGRKAAEEAERRARHQAGMPTSTVVGSGNGGLSDKQKRDAEAAARDARDPFLLGMRQYQEDNDPFQRGLRRLKQQQADREIAMQRMNDDVERQAAWGSQGFHTRRDARNRGGSGGFDRRSMGIMELSRGLEDAMAGASYGGIRGGIIAASNNISQFGMMFGPQGAIIGSLTSAAAVLGVTLYDSWSKAKDTSDKAAESARRYAQVLERDVKSAITGHNLRLEARDVRREGASTIQEADARIRDFDDRHRTMLAEERAERDKLDKMRASVGAGNMVLTPDFLREANMPGNEWMKKGYDQKMFTKEFADAYSSSYSRVNELQDQRTNAEKLGVRKALERSRIEATSIEQSTADRKEQQRRAFERGGDGPLTEREQLEKERRIANDENRRFQERFTSGQKYVQSREEEIRRGDLDQKYRYGSQGFQVEKEYQQSLRSSEEALRLGIIDEKRRTEMDADSLTKRDRDLRMAKYGDVQADGQTGFQSADIKSSAGFNAIMKAITYGGQTDQLAQLKRNGDISEEIKVLQEQVLDVLRSGPTTVNF